MSTLTVDLQVASDISHLPTQDSLTRWAHAAYEAADEKEVTIRLVDADESHALNKEYRGKDKPTNVLSFPFENPPGLELPILGDIVICVPVIVEEARQQGKAPEAHWAHMVIHGMLHLQGYDHVLEPEAEVMENLETQILSGLGFPNPYD